MNKIFGAIAGAGLILASSAPVFAARVGNFTTGPNSLNLVIGANIRAAGALVTNKGTVIQTVSNNATSGNNQSNGNTMASGTMADPSGNAIIKGENGVQLNSTGVSLNQNSCSTCPTGVTGANKITGPSSVNVVGYLDAKVALVGVTNEGTVIQTVNSNANSGNNTSNGNTIGGGINTGKAVVNQTTTTILNNTVVEVTQ